ncbi:MAG: MFS transporter [Actinomycetota bacterium]|nr:MFS transporter [Actinomycetota bacterium]
MTDTTNATDTADTRLFTSGRDVLVIATIMVGMFLAPFDSSIVNIALPSLATELGASLSQVAWVANAYLLTTASLILGMGRLGDVVGLRRIYTIGFAIFGVGSLACAFSPSLAWLISARVFQAMGSAMFFATGPAIVANTFPQHRRGRALGAVTLAVSVGLMAGPPMGGFLIEAFGWPSIFLINVPLAVVVVLISAKALPADELHDVTFDILGSIWAGGALAGLLISLSRAADAGLDLITIGAIAAAVACAVLFVYQEMRHPHPMIDLRLFGDARLGSAVLGPAINYLAMFSATFLLPFYLLRVQGLGESAAGLVLLATPATMAIASPFAGKLADRFDNRRLAAFGLFGVAMGLTAISLLPAGASGLMVGAALVLLGAGASLFGVPNTNLILSLVPRTQRGIGSALVGEARTVGMALGIALSSAVVTVSLAGSDMLERGGVLSAVDAQTFLGAMSLATRIGAGLAVLGVAVLVAGGRVRSGRDLG